MYKKTGKTAALLAITAALSLSGCASVISENVLKGVKKDITLEMVQSSPERFAGDKVVWGGIILSSENLEDSTIIEVFQTRLDSSHRPTNTVEGGGGRFLVKRPGYLDTFIHRPNKMLTVAGVIKGVEIKKIGKMDYPYPVITPIEMHVFEPQAEAEYLTPFPPWWYSPPYYDPYWPYYWPYYPSWGPWWGPFPP